MEIAFISLCIILILVELIKGLSANGNLSGFRAPQRLPEMPSFHPYHAAAIQC